MANMDKVFKAYDIRGVYPTDIDEELAWKVGYAAGQFLRSLLSGYTRGQASANRVVVARDMRPSSESLAGHLIEGVLASGLSCVDIGMCDTPLVYFAINHLGACGGIQVTASHNPPEYNGFKISGQKARPVGENTGLKDIKHIVATTRRRPIQQGQVRVEKMDLWKEYRTHVLQFLNLARPLKLVVDASNGMAGKMVPAIFDGAADLNITPLNYAIGEGFAHPPNPLIESNLDQLRAAVKDNGADFGACFDGDADRCMFVDESGATVRCDLVTALLGRRFLAKNPGSTVVYDLRSSRVVAEEIRAAGGVPRRERVGHAFMKKAMADTHAVFGGELSGHFYFRDNWNADSGAIVLAVACSAFAAQDKPMSQWIRPLQRYVQTGELNFTVPDKQGKMNELAKLYANGEIDHLDGVTVSYPDWWFNVRPSNTEPLLRLNLEARDQAKLQQELRRIEAVLGKPVAE